MIQISTAIGDISIYVSNLKLTSVMEDLKQIIEEKGIDELIKRIKQ